MAWSEEDLSPNGQVGVEADNASRKNASESAHVLMIPYASQGHITPSLDLAYQLVSRGNIIVTLVAFQEIVDRLIEKGLSSDAIRFLGVPDDRPDFNPPAQLTPFLKDSLRLGHNLEPFIQRLLGDGERPDIQRPTCLVTDIMHWWSSDIASRLNIPRYTLAVGSSCYLLTLLSFHVTGVKEGSGGAIPLPGLPPLIRGVQDSSLISSVSGGQILNLWPKPVIESDGIIMNTFLALESPVVDSLRTLLPKAMPLMSVGPLGLLPASVSTTVSVEGIQLSDEALVANWLDQQPPLSVVYVSFGTTGLLRFTKRHLVELARGLEGSQQRFVWVLRATPDVHDVAEALPDGFRERVKGRGLLLTGWAPQKQILEHPSTGAFLSSCGWNSALETLTRGVPVIGWPSFADQPIICRYLDVMAKVAVELPQQKDCFVDAEEIGKTIRVVLQSEVGKAMRERAGTYKTSIAEALAPGGSSHQAVQKFADLIKSLPVPRIKSVADE